MFRGWGGEGERYTDFLWTVVVSQPVIPVEKWKGERELKRVNVFYRHTCLLCRINYIDVFMPL